MDFLVAKDDLHRCSFSDSAAPEPGPGQALLSVERFGLTSNNITYAVFGEAMSYWSFFPAQQGWGRMPVWGFAQVSASREPRLDEGTRVYGYLPPSSELLLRPERIDEHGFIDASAHRAQLPAVYNSYTRVDTDPVYDAEHEGEQMLLRPLFFTSYLLDDFLAEADFFTAKAVLISSASSRTASALAYLLSQRSAVEVIGLTSARSARFARDLGVYEHVLTYDELDELPAGRAVYVDISGDGAVRAAVHTRYGEDLVHSAVVGATHHDRMDASAGPLPGPAPAFFFAPNRVAKRAGEWGAQALAGRIADAWRQYLGWTSSWLRVVQADGAQALERVYLDLLDGHIDPAEGHVLSLRPDA